MSPAGGLALEDDFPGWRAWRSSAGRWWASRTGPGARYGADDPRPMTVDGDDEAGLREALARAEAAGARTEAG